MKVIFFLCFSLAWAILPIPGEAEAQNCPQDWHPPPCGTPPNPVKDRKLEVVKEAEQVHWELATLFGLAVVASCAGGPTGDPRVDTPRKVACYGASAVAAVMVAAQQWEKRLIEKINAARDGGTQEVVMLSDMTSPSYDIITDGDPYLEALAEHLDAINALGDMINNSVDATFACDQWAMTDIQGITCGDQYRAWTDQLFIYMGQHYDAAASIDAVLAQIMTWDQNYVDWNLVNDLNEEASFDNGVGWEYQQ